MNLTKLTAAIKRDAEKHDLVVSCYHEAGHWAVAFHFGLHPHIRMQHGEATIDNKGTWGQVHYLQCKSAFRRAVIGWAGPLMQSAIEESDDPEKAKMLLSDAIEVQGLYCSMWDMIDELSGTDQAAMLGHPQRWRACKTAAAIIVRHWDKLRLEADSLIDVEKLVRRDQLKAR